MASGKTHSAITTLIASSITVASLTLVHPVSPVASAGLIAGSWLGLIIDPDLDHHVVTESELKVLRFNRTLGALWLGYWWFYHRAYRHRDPDTHSWPKGTAIRFLYGLWVPISLSLLAFSPIADLVLLFWSAVFFGLSASDIGHLVTDWIWDNTKRVRGRR